MIDFLGAISARAFPQRDALQPRLATRFEAPQPEEVPLGVLESAAAPREAEPPAPAAEPRRDDPASALTARLDALDRLVRTLPKPATSITHQQTIETTQPLLVQPSEVRVERHHEQNTIEHHHSESSTEHLIEQQRDEEHHDHHHTERVVEGVHGASPALGDEVLLPPPTREVPPAGSGRHSVELRTTHERLLEREMPGERVVEHHSATHERVIERDHEHIKTPVKRVIHERPGTRVIERILERTESIAPRALQPPRILERVAPPARTMPEPEPPSIHVSIGRIEIRATNAPEARPRAVTPRTSTLDEYLRRRDRGAR
jgi:hypothetical protein